MDSGSILYLAKKLKNGYIYDERYCNELLKLLGERAGDNFCEIVRCIIEVLHNKNVPKIKMSQ